MDYPSVGQVLAAIKEREISVILAVTEDFKIFYDNFKKTINKVGKAEMGHILPDSSNLVDLVIDQYRKLSEHIRHGQKVQKKYFEISHQFWKRPEISK